MRKMAELEERRERVTFSCGGRGLDKVGGLEERREGFVGGVLGVGGDF